MLHSLIIPNRDYTRYLRHCLWSIERSASFCGQGPKDYEVIVVDEQSADLPPTPFCGRIRILDRRTDPFCKPRLLNEGLDEALGGVLTFLDADAIVPLRFMESTDRLRRHGPMALTKLCYRVRCLKMVAIEELDDTKDRAKLIDGWFARYGSFPRGFEGYGWTSLGGRQFDEPAIDLDQERFFEPREKKSFQGETRGEPVFGNSQFSITRAALGDLRFDEGFVGRGCEDLWMNRAIFRRHGKDYRAAILTDSEYAILHISNPPGGEEWGPGKYNKVNCERYHSA